MDLQKRRAILGENDLPLNFVLKPVQVKCCPDMISEPNRSLFPVYKMIKHIHAYCWFSYVWNVSELKEMLPVKYLPAIPDLIFPSNIRYS
ncbi:hypothetical protein AB205_0131530 [Aquarana catesbeiana]|uniref:Uncharacterized protein n=1 Tax=Aquarana catesbeiana TaxID=8400 RepID=A0A2G9RXV8_AQUCT|nr:hypothetical protein AB205_0131530 [Aquarana catesbeiana]